MCTCSNYCFYLPKSLQITPISDLIPATENSDCDSLRYRSLLRGPYKQVDCCSSDCSATTVLLSSTIMPSNSHSSAILCLIDVDDVNYSIKLEKTAVKAYWMRDTITDSGLRFAPSTVTDWRVQGRLGQE